MTHNANLVVNCDAEQVIIAANNDEVISYRSGALEYGDHGAPNSMCKAICDVLEGDARRSKRVSKNTGWCGLTPSDESQELKADPRQVCFFFRCSGNRLSGDE